MKILQNIKQISVITFSAFSLVTHTQDVKRLAQSLKKAERSGPTAPIVLFGGPTIKASLSKKLDKAKRVRCAMYKNATLPLPAKKFPADTQALTNDDAHSGNRRQNELMHHKLLTFVDKNNRKISGTGSCHWNDPAFKNSYEDFILLEDPGIYNQYEKLFTTQLKTSGKAIKNQAKIENPPLPDKNTKYPKAYFAPTTSDSRSIINTIKHLINTETPHKNGSIKMAYERISHPEIIKALAEAQQKGCAVKILLDRQALPELKKQIISEKIPLKTFRDNNCIYTNTRSQVCHKFMILNGQQLVVTGSSNLSVNAENDNNENILVLDDKAVINAYNDRFNKYINEDTSIEPTDLSDGFEPGTCVL